MKNIFRRIAAILATLALGVAPLAAVAQNINPSTQLRFVGGNPVAYSIVYTGTTATGGWQATQGPGTAGQVMMANGAGALPTWSSNIVLSSTLGQSILGTTTNNTPCAGCVAEESESSLTAQTVNTTVTTVTSISLTAGKWVVSMNASTGNGGTNTFWKCGISTTAAFTGTSGKNFVVAPLNTTAQVGQCSIPALPLSLSGTTTVNLLMLTGVANITTGVDVYLYARRVY